MYLQTFLVLAQRRTVVALGNSVSAGEVSYGRGDVSTIRVRLVKVPQALVLCNFHLA